MPRLNWIKVKGFRAFTRPQELELRGPMAVVWAPNSQGKTSLAEAIEFLLTGKTIRRELAGSAVREFSDCLRNAHLPPDETVEVAAEIEDSQGVTHKVQRFLVRDYAAKRSCESRLLINGDEVRDLSSIGVPLSHPPLEAPILMQHTVRYVLMAPPQERADYFKALLEISDLEDIRTQVAGVKTMLSGSRPSVLSQLEAAASQPEFQRHLQPLLSRRPSAQQLEQALKLALRAAIPEPEELPQDVDERLSLLKKRLEEKRRSTFPLDGLSCQSAREVVAPEPGHWNTLQEFVELQGEAEEETVRLSRLFNAVLDTPGLADLEQPADCPVCETPDALTPQRVEAIRAQIQASAKYQTARSSASKSIETIKRIVEQTAADALATIPTFLTWNPAQREAKGFSESRMKELLGTRHSEVINTWRARGEAVKTAQVPMGPAIQAFRETSEPLTPETLLADVIRRLRECAESVGEVARGVSRAARDYRQSETHLGELLRNEIDRQSDLETLRHLVELAESREELFIALAESYAHAVVSDRIDRAVTDIDKAKGLVLDEKFRELSNEIERWWHLLRPDEVTRFAGISRAGSGRRFLDLKAELLPHSDEPNGIVVRDAIAVFSDSQLNCLGLAAFLARNAREAPGFVILDDPVTASDPDHRAMFETSTIEELLRSDTQVILLTHDEQLSKNIQQRYQHQALDVFMITMDEPALGAEVAKTSDTFDAYLARARPFLRVQNPEARKIAAGALRDAAERLCKEILVQSRRAVGHRTASLSDYDGKNIGDLEDKVNRHLSQDPSHPGKLRAAVTALNPGSHDDSPPSPTVLVQSMGDLRFLRKTYVR